MDTETVPLALLPDGRPMSGLADLVTARAAASPGAVAVSGEGPDLTYSQLDERVSKVASGLVAAGVGPEDRVVYLGPNSGRLLEVLHGAARAAAIPVPVNHRLSANEVRSVLRDAEPSFVVADRRSSHLVGAMAEWGEGCPVLVADPARRASYEDWRDSQTGGDPGLRVAAGDTQLILYTSGTTGLPKGIELTGANLAHALRAMQTTLVVDTESVAMAPIPFFHIAGLGMALLTCLDGGRLLLGDATSAEDLLHRLVSSHVSHAAAVPAVLQQLLSLPAAETADWSALRMIVYGAAPMNPKLLARTQHVLGCGLMQGYGLTESTGGVFVLSPDDHRAAGERPELLATVGRALPGVEARVVDPATGRDVPTGQPGEVWVAGPWVMKGYWRRPELTAETVVDGRWLRTGDGGVLDPNGYLNLRDRTKDMIVSGGENVYPGEVEKVLLSYPGVTEAAVVGIPSERWGESPFAFVVYSDPDLRPAAVISWTRTQLAHYKCPVGIRLVAEMPRNAAGKILKTQLRLMHSMD